MLANIAVLGSNTEKLLNFNAFIFDNKKGNLKNFYKASILL